MSLRLNTWARLLGPLPSGKSWACGERDGSAGGDHEAYRSNEASAKPHVEKKHKTRTTLQRSRGSFHSGVRARSALRRFSPFLRSLGHFDDIAVIPTTVRSRKRFTVCRTHDEIRNGL